jgi:GNAT superfamily N-acetyltransferase
VRELLQEYRELTEGLTLKDLKPGLKLVLTYTGDRYTVVEKDSDGDWILKKGRKVGYVLTPDELDRYEIAGKRREDSGVAGIKFEVKGTSGAIDIYAYEGRRKVGVLQVSQSVESLYADKCWGVEWIEVNASHRRKGVGTALYRKAAAVLCKLGNTLCSFGEFDAPWPAQRSPLASVVWKKELRAGHVVKGKLKSRSGITKVYYKYKCPPKF